MLLIHIMSLVLRGSTVCERTALLRYLESKFCPERLNCNYRCNSFTQQRSLRVTLSILSTPHVSLAQAQAWKTAVWVLLSKFAFTADNSNYCLYYTHHRVCISPYKEKTLALVFHWIFDIMAIIVNDNIRAELCVYVMMWTTSHAHTLTIKFRQLP